jgi:hypothetical protein
MIIDSIVIAALPIGTTWIVVAVLILAVVFAVGGFLLIRSTGKKGNQAPGAGASDWQRQQAQQGAWNQQPGGWGQQAPGQQPGGWGQQQAGGWGQQAQQQAGGWAAPNQQQPGGWGQQSPQQAGAWGAPGQAQQQPGGWGAPAGASPAQQPAWGAPNAAQPQQANPWGGQSAQPAWDAAPAAAPQDPWAQQQAGGQWGQQGASPAAPSAQQSPTGYGGNSAPAWGGQTAYGGQSAADSWGAPVAPAGGGGGASMPSWQQPGGFNQSAPGAMYAPADSDKTMLRPGPAAGPQAPGAPAPGSMGMVRVEEGKEPGRIYEVRKDSLSIGRSRESDIFLEDLAVSRLHASILNMGNGNYALKDEGSANGTKVNGQLVNKYQTYPLQEGDRIQLGQTVLVFGKR